MANMLPRWWSDIRDGEFAVYSTAKYWSQFSEIWGSRFFGIWLTTLHYGETVFAPRLASKRIDVDLPYITI